MMVSCWIRPSLEITALTLPFLLPAPVVRALDTKELLDGSGLALFHHASHGNALGAARDGPGLCLLGGGGDGNEGGEISTGGNPGIPPGVVPHGDRPGLPQGMPPGTLGK